MRILLMKNSPFHGKQSKSMLLGDDGKETEEKTTVKTIITLKQ